MMGQVFKFFDTKHIDKYRIYDTRLLEFTWSIVFVVFIELKTV